MKTRTKLTLAGISILAGAILLSGCTASFCSVDDKAHILYAYDYGVSDYYDHDVTNAETGVTAYQVFAGNTNIYYTINRPTNTGSGIGKTDKDASNANIQIPSDNYFVKMDQLVLENALTKMGKSAAEFDSVTYEECLSALDQFGY